jgi:acetyl-CoA decarbonylase/synthase complex subunit gamma
VDTEGMSVLTGWASGKFTGEKIAAAVKASGLQDKLEKRRIIIPGYVSQISGELEEALPGWEVLVGPGECCDLSSFLKQQAAR